MLVLALLIGLTLGAVGGGGSILAVPVLVGVAGLAVTEATTASLIVVGTAATIGLVSDLPSGRVRVAPGIVFGLTGIGGATLGTALNRNLDEWALLLGFATLMVVVAAKMAHGLLRTRPSSDADAAASAAAHSEAHTAAVPATSAATTGTLPARTGAPAVRDEQGAATLPGPSGTTTVTGDQHTGDQHTGDHHTRDCRTVAGVDSCTLVRLLLAGTAVGFLTGLFGVGGGFVIVPALVLLLGFDIRSAAATSLLVIAINSAVALVLRADVGSVDWAVVAPFTALATAGVLVGRRVAHRVPARHLSTALTALVLAMAVWTAAQGIAALA